MHACTISSRHGIVVATLGLALLGAVGVRAAEPSAPAALDRQALLSRLQTLGVGYHTQAEWNALFRQVDALLVQAEQAKDAQTVIEFSVIKAMVYSDMLREHQKALDVLAPVRRRFATQALPALRRVYVLEAEVQARQGNEPAIAALIKEFKRSPAYDPERYGYTGGEGRNTPLWVTRPLAGADSSTSLTAMETSRQRAAFARGGVFPDFALTTTGGQTVRLADYRGRVLLVDFWVPGATVWQRGLPQLADTYARYQAKGFDVLGIGLAREEATSRAFLAAHPLGWPQVLSDTQLTRQLGVFGEASSYLLNKQGQIIGRNLTGADLVEAVKKALAE